DLGHAQYGLAAMTNAAETALIQGVDLYRAESQRMVAAYELHAAQLVAGGDGGALCGAALKAVSPDPMWEIGYNEFANRLGRSLPNARALVLTIRPTGSDHHMQWETLTHAEAGSAALDPVGEGGRAASR